jgi:hypothetical protein
VPVRGVIGGTLQVAAGAVEAGQAGGGGGAAEVGGAHEPGDRLCRAAGAGAMTQAEPEAAFGAAGIGGDLLPARGGLGVATAADALFEQAGQLELRRDDAALGGDTVEHAGADRVDGDAEAAQMSGAEEPEGLLVTGGGGAAQPVEPLGGARRLEQQQAAQGDGGGRERGVGGAGEIAEAARAIGRAARAGQHHEADGERGVRAAVVRGELQEAAPLTDGNGVVAGGELAGGDEEPGQAPLGIGLDERGLGGAAQRCDPVESLAISHATRIRRRARLRPAPSSVAPARPRPSRYTGAVLAAAVDSLDLAPVLAQFASDGYARLGRVVSDETLAGLGARIDDLMLERVRHEGLFFQRDAPSGRYEDLTYGAGWQGPSLHYRKIEKLELDPLFRAYIGNRLHERIARTLIDGPVALYRAVLFTKSASGGTSLPSTTTCGTARA